MKRQSLFDIAISLLVIALACSALWLACEWLVGRPTC